MKAKFLTLLLINVLLITLKSFCQDQNFENKANYRLKTNYHFYKVNNKYQIQQDTIFNTKQGFLINPNIDTVTIDKVLYDIITYPNFKPAKTRSVKRGPSNSAISQSNSSNELPQAMMMVVKTTDTIITKSKPVYTHFPLGGINNLLLCVPDSSFKLLSRDTLYSVNFWDGNNWHSSAGQLTVPFKLRPSTNGKGFEMTTDVTLGAYAGIKKRISRKYPNYITIPVVAGLSFININDNTSATTGTANAATGVYPGFTLASGLIFQFGNKINLGFVFGRDYASSNGSSWLYNNKTWYSFAIGFSFLK